MFIHYIPGEGDIVYELRGKFRKRVAEVIGKREELFLYSTPG